MSVLHSSDPIVIAQPTTVYKKLSWRIVEKYIRFEETRHMVRTIFNEHEFKETLCNLFKSAAKEGAMEGMREVMQSANSSSQTPAKAVLPSSAVGTNDPASIKGKKIPCINNLQLMFVGDVESPVFTNTNMLKRKLPVKLIDNKTGSLVSIGPEASAELEVGLLDGRYKKQKELKRDHILAIQLKPREKKSQYLLKGGSNRLTLLNGVGEIPTSLAITDTSRMVPTLNGTFCFSLVPSDPESSIQGATSNEFTVLDKKAKGSEKHHPPQGNSEVWRLERISRKGEHCKRLEEMGIKFVYELHARFESNPEEMKKILKNDFDPIKNHLMDYKPDASNHLETIIMNQGMGSYTGVFDQTTMNQQELPTSNQGLRPVEPFGLNNLSRFTESIPTIQTKDMENTMLHCAQSMQEHGNVVMETDRMYPPMDQRTFESQNLQIASNGDRGAVENPVLHCAQSLHEHGNTFMETYQHMYPPIDQRTFESQNPQIASDGEDHGGVANNPLSYGQGMVGYSDINELWPNTVESPLWRNF